MGKEKNKIRNLEEEKKLGEVALHKLVEKYSYNIVVDQFFMRTPKKIVEIEKILRNLKNKTGSAFVSKFLYENKNELSKLYKNSFTNNNFPEISCSEKVSYLKTKFLNCKRRKKRSKKLNLSQPNIIVNDNIKNEFENSNFKETKKNNIENSLNNETNKNKYIYAHLLINQYAHNNPLEYLPGKTIEERILTMKTKILELFPNLNQQQKINDKIEIDTSKKKDILSINESHTTKDSDDQINFLQ